MKRTASLVTAVALLGACATTEVEPPSPRMLTAEDPVPIAAEIDDLAWLAGRWRGEGLRGTVEEVWLPPAGGAMVGTFRLLQEGEPAFYELMTLARYGQGVVLSVKHFDPDMTAWEERDRATRFPLLRLDGKTAWFDGLTIKRQGDGLWVLLRMRGRGDAVREEVFRMRRLD